ncbi:DMT family transporter [Luteimonas aestuarii]|uniref:DMT family transporter n=1 Tax=Luteimonas aestuarii TaxID=453837 RepID=A0A4R5U3S3_9GAMM|nr:DMT family transporter [Luteimonas aestuarii]TDK28362.1 DMT family transporter [Luteimonas aestuarii]
MKAWAIGGIAFAVVIGALLPLQALINARLGAQTQGPLYAAFVSFLVGTCLLGALLLATRTPLWPAQPLAALPAWIWLGGVIGAAFVYAATLLVPTLGAGAMICLVVLGQVLGSLALDHYGVLGTQRPIDLLRVLGGVLVIVGAALVVRPWQPH